MANVAVVKCRQCGLGNTMFLGESGPCGRCGTRLDPPAREDGDASGHNVPVSRPSKVVSPLPDSTFRGLTRLAKAAALALGVVVFLDALFAAVLWQRAGLLDRIEAGEPVSHADALGSDRLVNGFTTGGWVLFAITAGLFIWWFRRAYGNLPSLGTTQRYSPGWAVGAWFVPILNLFRPWKMAEEIWRGSAPDGTAADQHGEIPRPVRGWFFIGIAAGVIGGGPDTSVSGADLRMLAGSQVLTVVSGLCAIWMVGKVTERQTSRRRAMTQSKLSASAAAPRS